ncbi:Hypp6419 [Branchiostoma lanceolatum]|uniref:Hypp6419 protein n=1 Tax=Branchiostoma lanceolatum TaxID=7740 RepID=A0A8J9YU48_BRALA|nr:Hypp6419 [Branchiostoma lanceolatum]
MRKDKKKASSPLASGPPEDSPKPTSPLDDPEYKKYLQYTSRHMIHKNSMFACMYVILYLQAQSNPTPANCALMWIGYGFGFLQSIMTVFLEALVLWTTTNGDQDKEKNDGQDIEKKEK